VKKQIREVWRNQGFTVLKNIERLVDYKILHMMEIHLKVIQVDPSLLKDNDFIFSRKMSNIIK